MLIGEMLLNGAEEAPGPVNALMQDLNMMVSDGGERTRAGRWGATAGSSGGGGGGGSWAHERVFVKYLFQELGMVMRVLVCCSKTGRGLDPSMPLSSPPPTTLPIPLSCADNHGKSIIPPMPTSPPPSGADTGAGAQPGGIPDAALTGGLRPTAGAWHAHRGVLGCCDCV